MTTEVTLDRSWYSHWDEVYAFLVKNWGPMLGAALTPYFGNDKYRVQQNFGFTHIFFTHKTDADIFRRWADSFAQSEPAANTGAPALTPPPKKGDVMAPNGHHIYWTENEVGGRTWISDEVGGGVHVWDTSLVDPTTLLAVMTKEAEFQRLEYEIKQRAERNVDQHHRTQFEQWCDEIAPTL